VDNFRFVNRFPDKPLIYNVAWKTGIYLIATVVVRYVEHLAPLLSKFGNFAEAHRHLVEEIVWPHFWLIQMWLIVLFFIYLLLPQGADSRDRKMGVCRHVSWPGGGKLVEFRLPLTNLKYKEKN